LPGGEISHVKERRYRRLANEANQKIALFELTRTTGESICGFIKRAEHVHKTACRRAPQMNMAAIIL